MTKIASDHLAGKSALSSKLHVYCFAYKYNKSYRMYRHFVYHSIKLCLM